ncbi:hypothetical protein Barb6_00237 [Bacteroidales bacterium Barb6]|nr:hypothetical protein Barb6_00237 [Bacteroidales bacterium Barb6]
MKKIDTISQLESLIGNTYIYAIIIVITVLLIAFAIANVIKWRGGKDDKSYLKRRIWFVITGIIPPIAFFLFNNLHVSSYIAKAPLQAKFSTANIFATLAIVIFYFIIGLLSMLILRRSKWGSILEKTK